MTVDVTVITPTILGREVLLEECKESVAMQTVGVVDHLVGLDRDEEGPAVIRNRLVEDVTTDWIAFLDDDDVLLPHHFEVHSDLMQTDADVVFSWCQIIDLDGQKSVMECSFDHGEYVRGPNTLPVVVTMKTQLFRHVGGFPDARYEDWELWKKLHRVGAKFLGAEEVTWHYRFTAGSRNQNS